MYVNWSQMKVSLGSHSFLQYQRDLLVGQLGVFIYQVDQVQGYVKMELRLKHQYLGQKQEYSILQLPQPPFNLYRHADLESEK